MIRTLGAIRAPSATLVVALCLAAELVPGEVWAAGGANGSPWMDLLWKTVNFAVLVGLIVYFARKPVAGFLARRAREDRAGLDAARTEAEDTAQQLAEQKQRIDAMESELSRMIDEARADGQEERRQLMAESEAHARRIKEQTQLQVEQELRKARNALQAQVAEETVRVAESLIKDRLDGGRQGQLVDEYVQQLGERK